MRPHETELLHSKLLVLLRNVQGPSRAKLLLTGRQVALTARARQNKHKIAVLRSFTQHLYNALCPSFKPRCVAKLCLWGCFLVKSRRLVGYQNRSSSVTPLIGEFPLQELHFLLQ